ncbi:MAG: CHASE3 domain-containing protein [Rhodospirillales bacterium]
MTAESSETEQASSDQLASVSAALGSVISFRTIYIFLFGGLGLIVIAVIAASWLMIEQIKADGWIEHTLQIQEDAREYEVLVQNMELGFRGYILSRNPRFLEPYATARADIPRMHERLLGRVGDNKEQMARLEHIARLLTVHQILIDKALDAATKANFEGAVLLFSKSLDDRVMPDLQYEFAAFQQEETSLLGQRRAEAEALSGWMIGAAGVAMSGAIITLCLAIILSRRRYLALARNEMTLSLENSELVKSMRRRAEELATARDQAEESTRRAEALLRDVHHRVGNSLQLVAAFLGLQANQSDNDDCVAALRAARDRVLSIASAQRRLRISESGDSVEAPDFIKAIVEDLRVNLQEVGPVTLESSSEDLQLLSKDAVSIGVIVTELATNAVKYAFPDGTEGTVTVSLTSRHDGETYVLRVSDDGIGLESSVSSPSGGLGSRIVDRLAAALGGEVERGELATGSERPGTVVSVIFPNPRLI